VDLKGKTYLITGCNSGLGEYTMGVLAARGAHVLGAARTLDNAKRACGAAKGKATPVECELSEPASVRAAVATVADAHELDGIIANAGIMALPKPVVKHGLELQFLTNHIGHFILINGLLDALRDDGRVVVLSSSAHNNAYPEGIRFDDLDAKGGYTAWGAYGQSKLANLLFAKQLATRLPKKGQTANSCHPGVISTNLGRHMPKPMMFVFSTLGPLLALKSVPQGSATQTFLAANPRGADTNGEYFADCNPARTSAHGRDAALAEALWDKTEELVAALE
jgi:NAD(P)-dependent dehydrogenase (short-subunit alcohol dehydrogenase family)